MFDLTHLHADGVFLRREALAHGYLDKDLVAGLRSGLLSRIRPGAYILSSVWSAADDVGRHGLRAHAVLRSHSSPLVLSHTSAAVEHGLRLYQPDLRRIHVTPLEGVLARTTRDIVYHQGAINADDVVEVNGCPVTRASRAALEAASIADLNQGLVILDSAVDLDLTDINALWREYQRVARWPGARRLQVAVRLARPGANSVGETLARFLMWTQHIPEPTLQFEVHAPSGQLIGRSDFGWPEYGLLGEFDGMQKYGRLRRAHESPGEALAREKVREDRLREMTGFLMVRIVWSDLFTPDETGTRIRDQIRRGSRLLA